MFQTRASKALRNHTHRRDTERSCSWGLGRHLWVRDERESSRMISGPGSGEQEIVWHSSSSPARLLQLAREREREEEAAMASTTSAASLVRLWAPPKTFSPSAASSSPSTSYSPSLSGSNSAFFASETLLRLRCSQAIAQQQQQPEQQQQKQRQRRQTGPVSIRAETTKAKGLSVEQGGRWLSSTTRHVRIFAGYIDPVTDVMDQSQLDKLTLMLDPDDEFLWPEDKVQAVYAYFKELVDHYAGAPLTEYTLRLIGSDIEHYIRKMLLAGEIKYNLDCRVLNFSMGKPRIDPTDVEDLEEEDEG